MGRRLTPIGRWSIHATGLADSSRAPTPRISLSSKLMTIPFCIRRRCSRACVQAALADRQSRPSRAIVSFTLVRSCLSVRPTSLAKALRALDEHSHSVKALAGRDIKRLLVGAGECGVGRLARDLDCPEIRALGIEHLNA